MVTLYCHLILWYNTIKEFTYCTVLYFGILYCSVLYYTVLYCTVLYCTVLYCTVLYCTVLYCTVLYCTVLYCNCSVLYCTVLYDKYKERFVCQTIFKELTICEMFVSRKQKQKDILLTSIDVRGKCTLEIVL